MTEAGGKVVGFVTWHRSGKVGVVGENAIHPSFQGRGLGVAQIRRVLEILKGEGCTCARVHTNLDPAHGPARAQYRKAGFSARLRNSLYHNSLPHLPLIPPPREVRVVPAGPREREEVARLAREIWGPIFELVREALGEVARASKGEEGRLLLAFWCGEPVGLAALDLDEKKALGTISSLGVSPRHRGKGVGTALCMEAFPLFSEAGLKHVRLAAGPGEDNEITMNFCWHLGLYREIPGVDMFAPF